MARNNAPKIELTAYDDLFQTDESRAEAKLSKIRDIPLSQIDEFPDHPFKVLMDEDMQQLVESIKQNGVMTPATIRLKEDGRYELVSGHRRKKACELAGLETLKCEVKELTRDEAIIVMVESNLQRSTILPSEKAFAYKMRLEAMNRQAGRPPKNNPTPMVSDFENTRTNEKLGKEVGESREQIRRFIRLTELVPEILQMVDERQIAFRPAVEISYLNEEQQYTLLEAMSYNDATAVEDCGFFESIPLWAVTLIGGLFITILSFIMIMSVYGRFFRLYLYTAIAPVPLSTFAGEPSQNVGKSFIKSYAAVCLEGAIIVLACIIFSLFAASPPAVDPNAAPVSMVWSYIGELIFNMLVLVGAVKMADRVVREMMGL